MTIGENLRRIREERGIEQARLAEAAGVSQAFISQVESNRRTLPLAVAVDAAQFMNCTVDELVGIKSSDSA